MNSLRWIEVDLSALEHNARAVRRLLGKKTAFSAVVKADAYGHGAAPSAKAALRGGADALAVTYLEEAEDLRRAGLRAPLLVMGPSRPEEAPLARKLDLAVMVDNPALLRALGRAGSRGRPVDVHVKVDPGLYRWGVPLSGLPALVRLVRKTRGVRLKGVFSHPGYMVGKNRSRVEDSLKNFMAVARALDLGPGVELHVADSAVLMEFPEFRLSRVRVGNLLYGINPSGKPLALKNPWRAFARLVHVEKLAVGEMVGYGGEFVATQPMTVAAVPAGYAHGLTLEPASRWIQLRTGQNYWGMLNGVKCPFVGRVGMSHCLVDVSRASRARVGDALQLPIRRTATANWVKIYK
jgi:alanine racemase